MLAYLLSGGNLYAFFILAIVFGICCGLISSVIHIYGRVPAFMAGLCIMFAGRGLAQTVAAKTMMLMAQAARFNNIVFFLIVIVVVYAVGYFLFNFTKLGKYQKLIGTNPKAAELSGINVNQYKLLAFLISGVTIGIASCLTVIRNAAINGNTGLNLETDVLLALCLGGLPMTGGSTSKMNSVLIGVAIYYILNNGLLLWGLNADYVDIVKAVFFLGTVAISLARSQYRCV